MSPVCCGRARKTRLTSRGRQLRCDATCGGLAWLAKLTCVALLRLPSPSNQAQARRLQLVVDKQVGELDRYKAELGDVRANYNSVRADAENMLKVMQSYEKQLNEYSAKEARWDALEKESVENVRGAARFLLDASTGSVMRWW